MSAEKNWQLELEEYIKQGEPGRIEKSEAWQTAIGLQAIDGLKTSAYLLDTAKEHIEGKISIDEAQKRIQSYYEQHTDRIEIENDTKEADIVSTRITKLLGEKQFSYEGLSVDASVRHLAKFTSDIWQIHPFCEGNGRMGRMWHSLLLGNWKELFFWLPIEELIQSGQKEYYGALAAADAQTDSAAFVELMLEIIRDSLNQITIVGRNTVQVNDQVSDQDNSPVNRLLSVLEGNTLSATELMQRLGLSHKPTFRKNYLNPALEQKLIERTIPDKPNSKNQKYKRVSYE